MELNEQLKNDGIAKGLCSQWQHKLDTHKSIEDLATLFIKGIDFCVCNDYPTLDFLRTNFKGKCEPYGVFIDDDMYGLQNLPNAVLNGTSRIALEYDGYSVGRVFVRHNSVAVINVAGHANVTIDAFDDSRIRIATTGHEARVWVNRYGNAVVECMDAGVKVRTINKNTY